MPFINTSIIAIKPSFRLTPRLTAKSGFIIALIEATKIDIIISVLIFRK